MILLLRHGPTDWNRSRRLQGRSETTLAKDAQELIRKWRIPEGFEQAKWWSSPLLRARETAKLLTKQSVSFDARLIELDWGFWEGSILSDVRKQDPARMRTLEARGLDFAPPRGESYRQVQRRVVHWIKELSRDEVHIAVTHRGVMMAALAHALSWDMREDCPMPFAKHAAVVLKRSAGDSWEASTIEL